MDEAEEILLSSLRSSGVSLPPGLSANASSIKDLSPEHLVSICAQSLRLIGGASASSPPTSLPDSAAERFKVCADIASDVKSIGYKHDLSFHQFLYPTNEESYNLLRFLVEKLSGSYQNRDVLDDVKTRGSNKGLKDTSGIDGKEVPHRFLAAGTVPEPLGESADAESLLEHVEHKKVESHCKEEDVKGVPEEARNSKELCVRKEDPIRDSKDVIELEETLASLRSEESKLRHEIESLKDQEKSLKAATQSKTLEVQDLDSDFGLLKEAAEMAFDNQHSVEFYLKGLSEQAERSGNLVKLEMQRRNTLKGTAEGRSEMLEQSMHAQTPELQDWLLKLKEIEQETEVTGSEIHRREIEHAELLVELDKLPKNPPRKYYIDRVTEITKNSWKQDADIHRILKEIREIQLESNSIEERLHRTYAVVEETVFRDTKNDSVGRQVYRLLTSIHDCFEQIREKTLATDRAKREAAEQEKKLASISSRSFDIHKLQQDLDAIRKENELLERRLHHD
ncbi:hypothetical protein Cni_G15144 [Canna indica]|uniref:Coiled-coil domain-containing protein 22 n=1 Tax=Canna indica TaxID=4628 RepID=A0AAQ3KFI5_9LILI|nr:hypothetical protein Cni_G15144 [Canna indica]